ncbi:peptidoglycan-binding protein [Conexibacter sp. JD483]|uniref:NlpC/P60 family protein n=1 Tax=unclassified Conexibacter TaxID=2627773 RepID=UPI0027269F9E|nr:MULTISPECIES: peptidoglycan-binding protein [unclassified Conexibacter]MDO8188299.1 peptidoglycan-binding protein [Conexibacter sp. CPCC 205706]MDO8198979.1 peptidoglycan-binding protein [Conexibacter sp. CPCC 205762]MDR9370987.1 peptidoglycan-binding protein [Conexibacter sp. JD483]
MSGQDVRVLQDYLTRAGFSTPVGGDFGPITLGNVKKFEKRYGLTVDGVVDSAFVTKIRGVVEPNTKAKPKSKTRAKSTGIGRHLGDRTLKKGMTGQDVRVLQDYLDRAGFTTTVDGQFGSGTLKLVKRFQQTQELPVTGIVDAQTVTVLRRIGDASSAGSGSNVGGADFDMTTVDAPIGRAKLLANGLAVAPADAPQAVKDAIEAGNEIATKPYVYGGGHGKWIDRGYDCSGSVSYALYRAGLLDESMPSGSFMNWEASGRGKWITTYANGGHMYMVIAGLRFDTSGANPSRWQSDMRSNSGFTVRHPAGY